MKKFLYLAQRIASNFGMYFMKSQIKFRANFKSVNIHNIKELVNLYLKVGEYIKGIYSTYDKAEIISKHGFNLVEVLKNTL